MPHRVGAPAKPPALPARPRNPRRSAIPATAVRDTPAVRRAAGLRPRQSGLSAVSRAHFYGYAQRRNHSGRAAIGQLERSAGTKPQSQLGANVGKTDSGAQSFAQAHAIVADRDFE